jgi:hypothetical protein
LFVDAAKRRWLARFWVKWGRIRDTRNFTYAKRECISDFCRKWGGVGFRGVYWFVNDIRWVSGIVGGPNTNTDAFLVYCGDFKFGVGDEGVKGLVPPNKEPGVVDEF